MKKIKPRFYVSALKSTLKAQILRKITDGKATGERTAEPFEKLQAELLDTVETLKERLEDLLEEYGEVIVRDDIGSVTLAVGLAVDPVTGE